MEERQTIELVLTEVGSQLTEHDTLSREGLKSIAESINDQEKPVYGDWFNEDLIGLVKSARIEGDRLIAELEVDAGIAGRAEVGEDGEIEEFSLSSVALTRRRDA